MPDKLKISASIVTDFGHAFQYTLTEQRKNIWRGAHAGIKNENVCMCFKAL